METQFGKTKWNDNWNAKSLNQVDLLHEFFIGTQTLNALT